MKYNSHTPRWRQEQIIDEFLDRVDRLESQDGCWIWTDHLSEKGYGRLWINGKRMGAHCFSYLTFVGPLHDDKPIVCHKCDNPACVRPDHLFAGTHYDNAIDREAKGRRRKLIGEKHPLAKLTAEQAEAIRLTFQKGVTTYRKIGEAYGVNHDVVRRVVTGKTYQPTERQV